MKAKDLIKALQNLDPEADVVINVKQSNKVYGVQLPIEYGSGDVQKLKLDSDLERLNCWVNRRYGGSITVHLPDGVYIARLPKEMKPYK